MNIPVSINDFSGNMVGDDRSTSTNVCTIAKHFDTLSRKHRMTPQRSFENGDTNSATEKITKFIYYGGKVYGLAVNAGTAQVNIRVESDLTTNGGAWSDNTNGQDSGGTRKELVFNEYNAGSTTTSFAYGWRDGLSIFKADLSGSAVFVNNAYTPGATYTNFAQGVVHSKDDKLYMFADNFVFTNSASAGTDSWAVGLTLPKRYIIASACEFGDYLAIGCRSVTGNGKSVVYLWDRVTTSSFLLPVDWGNGDLYMLGELSGTLLGVSVVGTNLTGLRPRLQFRSYVSGSGGTMYEEFICDSIANTISGAFPVSDKVKGNNRLYFMASVVIGGVTCEGVWSIGGVTGFPIHLEYFTNNSEITGVTPSGFALFGDYMFVAYRDAGGAWAMSKTNDVETYSSTSVWESTINPNMTTKDRTKNKTLKVVAGSCVPLPNGATLTVKYKVDGGAYTTVFSQTTTGVVTTETLKDLAGSSFTTGREYKFRVESTGGAEPTELKYSYEILESLM